MSSLNVKYFFLLFLLLVTCSLLPADLTNLRIIKAGRFKGLSDGRKMLLNNIHLEYKEYSLKCDTAIVNKEMNRARLYGNISIWDKRRKINCREAELYNVNNITKITLEKEVIVSKDSLVLKGENGFYDSVKDQFEIYENAELYFMPENLKIEAEELVLNQKENSFLVREVKNLFLFDSIYVHRLRGENLSYKGNDSLLTTKDDFETFSFKHGQKVDLPLSNNRSGSNKLEQYLKAFKSITPKDTMLVKGGKFSLSLKNNRKSYIKNGCYFSIVDTLGNKSTLTCDTVVIKEKFTNFDFNNRVIFRKDSIKITSGKAHFYKEESKLRVLKKPQTEIGKAIGLADSIFLWSDEDFNPQKLLFHGEALFVQENSDETPQDLNIISGKKITIYWKGKELDLMRVNKEAASVYFIYSENENERYNSTAMLEKSKKLMATNFVSGDSLKVHFKLSEPSQIEIFGKSTGHTYPPREKHKAIENIRQLIKRSF